ncbi:MAG: hypothetical protein ASARMPREDX12_007232 [Alectoria sarmentosa]|nr:MAG: hypothetical protein ASARMPREDX12_007232 [Alectoria sarmentosa]
MFSKRADGLLASKRKRSPSPSPSPMSKAPHNGSSHKKQQAENAAEASTSTSEGPVLPHTENAAAATVGPSNTVYGGTRAPNSKSSTTTRPGRPQPQPTMTGVAPNKMPEKAAAPNGIALPDTDNQATSAIHNSHQPVSNVVYPASNSIVYPASNNVVHPAAPPSTIPAYSLARRHRPYVGAFSNNPRDDFEVPRQLFDSVSSTGVPSNGPKNSGT